jgi:RNA polymerase sigma-70 factor (ECF subfamily)
MTSGDSTADLIERARRKEPDALNRLLGAFRNYLRLVARTGIDVALQGKADPSDLVQEALARASTHFHQFGGTTEAELAGWLRQIVARKLADLARKGADRNWAQEQSLDHLIDRSSLALHRLLPANGNSPSAEAQRREAGVVLSDVLAELSPDHREVVVLHDLEELGWPEVAARMGRSPAAVRMLWVRALKELRPKLQARLGA